MWAGDMVSCSGDLQLAVQGDARALVRSSVQSPSTQSGNRTLIRGVQEARRLILAHHVPQVGLCGAGLAGGVSALCKTACGCPV